MNKIIKYSIIILSAFLFFCIAQQNEVHASSKYKIKVVKNYGEDFLDKNAYHPKNIKKNIWAYNGNTNEGYYSNGIDTSFSKKVFNLKKQKNQTFFIVSKVKVYHKGKIKYYYYICNRSKTKSGYVPINSFKKGYSPYGYQTVKIKWHPYGLNVYLKNFKKTIYLWNPKHTKKITKLNDYPSMTWTQFYTATIRHNGKDKQYYRVFGKPNNDQRKKDIDGFIDVDSMQIGYNPNHTQLPYSTVDEFNNTSEYIKYLKTHKSQKLSREIMQLFPNSEPDLRLSQIAVSNYDSDYEPDSTEGYRDIISFPTIQSKLYKNKKASTETKVKIIKKELAKQGYNAKKRAAMSNYKLGIQIVNNLNEKIIGNDGNGGSINNRYVFILAKKD